LLFVFVELFISLCFVSLRQAYSRRRRTSGSLLAMVWELGLFVVLDPIRRVRETFGIRMADRGGSGHGTGSQRVVVARSKRPSIPEDASR
jgi:hypothetical protein